MDFKFGAHVLRDSPRLLKNFVRGSGPIKIHTFMSSNSSSHCVTATIYTPSDGLQ